MIQTIGYSEILVSPEDGSSMFFRTLVNICGYREEVGSRFLPNIE
jgi:hypothetical protein